MSEQLTYLQQVVGFATESEGTKLLRKQILPRNKTYRWPNRPGMMLSITDEVLDQIVANFTAGVLDVVPFFKVNDRNAHVEDPELSRGRIVGLEKTDTGLDAIIDPVDDSTRNIILSTQLGASAGIKFEYQRHDTGENVGAVLRHVAWTPEPWIPGMKPFEEVSLSGESYEAVFLSEDSDEHPTKKGGEEEMSMTKEEIQALVTESVQTATAELSTQLEETRTQLADSQEQVRILSENVNNSGRNATAESVESELSAMVTAGLAPAIAELARPLLMESDTEVTLSADETSTVSAQLRKILDLVPKLNMTELGESGVPEGAIVVLSAEQVKDLGFNTEKKEESEAELSADEEAIKSIVSHIPTEQRKEA